MVAKNEISILERVVAPDAPDLTVFQAEAVMNLKFAGPDIERMNALAAKSRDGNLTESEREELTVYAHLGDLIALMKSKARLSLDLAGGPERAADSPERTAGRAE